MTVDHKWKRNAAAQSATQRNARPGKRAAQKEDRPAYDALVCPPDAAGRSLKMRLLGYFCRVPVMFCAVVGLSTLLNTAFRLSEGGAAVLPGMLAVVLLSLIFYGRWYTTLAGIALSGGLLGWYLSAQSNVTLFLQGAVDVGFHGILQRLYSAGYYSYAKYLFELTEMEKAHTEMLSRTFVAILTFLIAALFVPFLARRIRIAVPLVTSVLLIVPVFTFNLPVSNWAVTAIIAGSSALLIMWGYQRRYDRDGDPTQNSELFADMQRPAMPSQALSRAKLREEEKARKQERREQLRRRQATGLVTVEEEINDYLSGSPKKQKPAKQPREVGGRTAEQKAAIKQERAQLRAVRDYDRITRETRCAMGGVAGFCVMLLVLFVLLLPTAAVDGPFDTIDAIEHRVQYYREYVTATLRGNDPALEMYAYGESIRNEEPHSTTAETQLFDEISLFRLYAQFNSPVYLQGWVGVDYTDGAWTTADDADLYAWRELYEADDMPGEAMYENFLKLMIPTSEPVVDQTEQLYQKYLGYEEYGFVAYMINIRRLRQMGAELYLPRVTSNTLRIWDYRTTEAVIDPWAIFFDGVAVSSVMDEALADYSVEAYIPLQLHEDWAENTAKLITAYNASAAEILRYDESRNKNGFRPDYANTYITLKKDERYSLAQAYIEQLSSADRATVLAGIRDAQTYSDFVYATYLDTADSEIISSLAQTLYQESYADEDYLTEMDEESGLLRRTGVVEGAEPLNFALADRRNSTYVDTYTQRHALTMSVINYLVENHEYSLEITTTADETLDGVENFLTVTKQGYCVQFASAAALILREYGIPVRYMEGYVAADYTRRVNTGKESSRFAAEVRDSDRHAWIEVWYDGIGWVIYETTPAYYMDLYGEYSTTAATLTPRPSEGPSIDTPSGTQKEDTPPVTPILPGDELDEGELGGIDVEWLIRAILLTVAIVAVLAGIVIAISTVIRRAKQAQRRRTLLAEQIIAHHGDIFDTPEAREAAAKQLIRNTLGLLSLFGSAPKTGELRDDYAQRLSFDYEDVLGYPMEYDDGALGQRESVSPFRLGALLEAVAAEEFGYGMSDRDMKKLAELYLHLHDKRATRIPAPRRFTLHYVKRLI